MGGKGRRRREKNYREAHGGGTASTLPPPPKAADLHAVPSKLRRIMQLRRPPPEPSPLRDSGKKRGDNGNEKMAGDEREKNSNGKREFHNVSSKAEQDNDDMLDGVDKHVDKKRKRRRKRITMDDLQLQNFNMAAAGNKRREKRKKFFEEKKKKQKKTKTEEVIDFPGREQIKFGDVVNAPPKLTFPKATKTGQDAFHERLRLQAVEAYRKRKGWTSRPGIQLPSGLTTLSSEEAQT